MFSSLAYFLHQCRHWTASSENRMGGVLWGIDLTTLKVLFMAEFWTIFFRRQSFWRPGRDCDDGHGQPPLGRCHRRPVLGCTEAVRAGNRNRSRTSSPRIRDSALPDFPVPVGRLRAAPLRQQLGLQHGRIHPHEDEERGLVVRFTCIEEQWGKSRVQIP